MPSLIYRFNNLSKHPKIAHFISTRQLGSMTSARNRNKLAEYVSIDPAHFVYPEQVHGDHVAVVENNKDRIGRADALITNRPNLCLAVMMADCVPILLYDPVQQVIGAVHAGWRGSAQRILLPESVLRSGLVVTRLEERSQKNLLRNSLSENQEGYS